MSVRIFNRRSFIAAILASPIALIKRNKEFVVPVYHPSYSPSKRELYAYTYSISYGRLSTRYRNLDEVAHKFGRHNGMMSIYKDLYGRKL